MKTFKQFLEEAYNAVQTFRDKGFRTRNLFGPGGRYKKLEPIPKPNTQAKLSDKDKKDYDKYTNPVKPPEKPIDPYAIPVKKA